MGAIFIPFFSFSFKNFNNGLSIYGSIHNDFFQDITYTDTHDRRSKLWLNVLIKNALKPLNENGAVTNTVCIF